MQNQNLGQQDFPGGGNGNPLQYSCLGNPKDRGACWVTARGVVKELDMTEHQIHRTENWSGKSCLIQNIFG